MQEGPLGIPWDWWIIGGLGAISGLLLWRVVGVTTKATAERRLREKRIECKIRSEAARVCGLSLSKGEELFGAGKYGEAIKSLVPPKKK